MISSDKNIFFDTDENTNIGTIFAEIDGSPDIECPGLDENYRFSPYATWCCFPA